MSNLFTRLSIIAMSIIAFQFVSSNSSAQTDTTIRMFKSYAYIQPNAGITQYFGDINQNDFYNSNPQLGFGGVLGYQMSPVFGARVQFLKTVLYSERTDQNLKFSSDLWDATMHLTININEIFSEYNDKRFVNFYLFGGAGLTSYKSKIENLTTGEVLNEHTDRQQELVVPVGAGVVFRISNTLSANLEYGDHIIFKSDVLDFTNGIKKNDHFSYISAGIQFRFGSRDTDKDGVMDKDDLCPETPGKIELAGCPDTDNDGIADKDDACPDVAGKTEFKGCPDTDGDKIPDKDDACPTVAGTKELNGCPDKDGDGIADKDDKCPDMAGKKDLAGCPDRDGDGIADNMDACPDVKGPAGFTGCPDTDGDGIADNEDNCPEVAGIAANNGCPEALNGALMQKIVYFDADESVVLAKNIIDLNEIAAFMNENPDAVVSVAGHTDSRESVEYNLRLSEKRADFVIKYLIKKGMKNASINKTFFGKSKPVADNNIAEGRALNRRVEIKITK
jgi:OOP family OmpA-OmpF porin